MSNETIDNEKINEIVKLVIDDELDKLALPNGVLEEFVKEITNQITSNKLRNIYNSIIAITEEDDEKTKIKRFLILYPKIKYQKKDSSMSENIISLFEKFILKIKNLNEKEMSENIDRFKKMMEMMVAFYKYHENDKKSEQHGHRKSNMGGFHRY